MRNLTQTPCIPWENSKPREVRCRWKDFLVVDWYRMEVVLLRWGIGEVFREGSEGSVEEM